MPRVSLQRILSLLTISAGLGLLAPTGAMAATVTPAPASQYNSTPACPVSATDIECSWNLPADPANLFTALDYGQCPYWAAEKYPSLVSQQSSSDPLAGDWDGSTWAEHAEQEGLTVSTTPASGDLAVWQATAADSAGHVAYVEAVDGDAIIVSQMDGQSSPPFPAMQGSTEYISAANIAYFQQTYGLEFIQTGTPSSTPLANLEAAATPASGTPAAVTTATTTATAPLGTTPRASSRTVTRAELTRAERRAAARRLAQRRHRRHAHRRQHRHHVHATQSR